MLTIYNSYTKKKQPFIPLEEGKISFYVCGNTVYDYCHLGHARTMVSFDVIYRHLLALGYDVTYVRNITDIDDKIIQRANENNETCQSLTERMIEAQNEDATSLNLLSPTKEPKATGCINEIVDFISALIEKGVAYIGEKSGDVYFEVAKFSHYGQLSKKDLEGLQAGARVEVVTDKKDPLDFVLWKQAKSNEPSWSSPWGDGRPGWHIECSAMSMNCLGEQFDIHGGGFDLMFPHHENEIAQSEALTGKTFANLWMHVGFLNVDNEKMSKSLGNFFTIRDVLKHYDAEVLRLFLISSHYRSQLNYSTETLDSAKASLDRLYQSLDGIDIAAQSVDESASWVVRFNDAMNDDFNTPVAISILYELSKELNRVKLTSPQEASQLAGIFLNLSARLGIVTRSPDTYFKGESALETHISALIEERMTARANKDWQRADAIRDQLLSEGIELLDSVEGVTWRRV